MSIRTPVWPKTRPLQLELLDTASVHIDRDSDGLDLVEAIISKANLWGMPRELGLALVGSTEAAMVPFVSFRVCLHSSDVEKAGAPINGEVSREAEFVLATGALRQTPPTPMSVDPEFGEITTL